MRGAVIQYKLWRGGGLHFGLPSSCALVAMLCLCPGASLAFSLQVTDAELKCHDELCASVPRPEVKKHALAIQAKAKDSFVAEYILGSLEVGDANWPDAIRHLKAARAMVERVQGHEAPDKPGELPWLPLILNALAEALDGMDRNKEAQTMWAEIEALHLKTGIIPDFGSRRIQSLLKLGRISEARQLADSRLSERGLLEPEAIARRTDMARVQFALEPEGSKVYELFKGIVRDAENIRRATVPRADLGFHARRQGDYRVAMDIIRQSASFPNPFSPSHPYWTLSDMDIAACRWDDARVDIRHAWDWLQCKKRNVRHELLADTRIRVAQFYLATGYPDRAEMLARQYVDQPIRSGFSSRPIEQWEAGVNLLCWAASRQVRQIETAAAISRPWYERIWVRFCHVSRLWREAVMARRVRTLVVGQIFSGNPLRDAVVLVDVPVWMWGDLCQVLGSDRFSSLLESYPLMGAQKRLFLGALQAEASFAAGRWADASIAGEKALPDLPEEERLLRARIFGIIGESLRRQGDFRGAVAWFGKAYRANPAIFLMTGIKIPVVNVPTQLAGSDFLQRVDGGFGITINQSSDDWTFAFGPLDSAPLVSGKISILSVADLKSMPFRLHRVICSPIGLLKDGDYASLEGQAVAGPVEKAGRFDKMIKPETYR